MSGVALELTNSVSEALKATLIQYSKINNPFDFPQRVRVEWFKNLGPRSRVSNRHKRKLGLYFRMGGVKIRLVSDINIPERWGWVAISPPSGKFKKGIWVDARS